MAYAMNDLDTYLSAIQQGNADAFERWVGGSEARMRLSLKKFASLVDTEAILQEALLRVWQVAPKVTPDGSPNSLLRLAIRIAHNLAISEMRRIRPSTETDLDSSSAAEDNPTPDPLLRSAILKCHDKLPQKPRQALAARLETSGSQSDQELAEKLGMTLNTFLQNFTRARRFLAECLQGMGIELEMAVDP